MNLVLGWPPSVLSPNSRAHWSAKARAAAAYRQACYVIALDGGARHRMWDRPHLLIQFVPPSRRRADLDNMLASIKSGLDGLALAMRCDDSRFRLSIERVDAIGGMVKVTVRETNG